MPEPEKGESERDFLKNCIPQLMNEHYEHKRAIAICFAIYRKKGTDPKSPKPKRQ